MVQSSGVAPTKSMERAQRSRANGRSRISEMIFGGRPVAGVAGNDNLAVAGDDSRVGRWGRR
jgi:hypothetical protein